MMDPVVEVFRDALSRVKIGASTLPFMSTSLGTWVRSAEALGPDYWAQHIRRPVLFADAMAQVLAEVDPSTVYLEVGPRDVLTTLSRMQTQGAAKARVLASLGDAAGDPAKDLAAATATIGRLWTLGAEVKWEVYHAHEPRHRVPLPTYPFERRSHWLAPLRLEVVNDASPAAEPVTSVPLTEPTLAHMARADEAAPG